MAAPADFAAALKPMQQGPHVTFIKAELVKALGLPPSRANDRTAPMPRPRSLGRGDVPTLRRLPAGTVFATKSDGLGGFVFFTNYERMGSKVAVFVDAAWGVYSLAVATAGTTAFDAKVLLQCELVRADGKVQLLGFECWRGLEGLVDDRPQHERALAGIAALDTVRSVAGVDAVRMKRFAASPETIAQMLRGGSTVDGATDGLIVQLPGALRGTIGGAAPNPNLTSALIYKLKQRHTVDLLAEASLNKEPAPIGVTDDMRYISLYAAGGGGGKRANVLFPDALRANAVRAGEGLMEALGAGLVVPRVAFTASRVVELVVTREEGGIALSFDRWRPEKAAGNSLAVVNATIQDACRPLSVEELCAVVAGGDVSRPSGNHHHQPQHGGGGRGRVAHHGNGDAGPALSSGSMAALNGFRGEAAAVVPPFPPPGWGGHHPSNYRCVDYGPAPSPAARVPRSPSCSPPRPTRIPRSPSGSPPKVCKEEAVGGCRDKGEEGHGEGGEAGHAATGGAPVRKRRQEGDSAEDSSDVAGAQGQGGERGGDAEGPPVQRRRCIGRLV